MQKLLSFLRKTGYYTPFTLYLLAFASVLIPGYLKLRHLGRLPDSAYTEVFRLLLSVVLFFSISIILFGLLTVLSAFIYFKWQQRRGGIRVQLRTSPRTDTGKRQQVELELHPVLLPLAGFIRIRLFYDGNRVSPKITPAGKHNSFLKLRFRGNFVWELPEIREYRIDQVLLYFEDFFQFFSMASAIDAGSRFHIGPVSQDVRALRASPRKTEETETRIEELKRVEGELINYKSFETNDDVRRIVWKIYARNKELVVRVPEILDPYASHIYLYASFYSVFKDAYSSMLDVSFLNYYKTMCWSVYSQLSAKGLEVRFLPDQEIPPANWSLPAEQVNYALSVSKWKHDQGLKDLVKPGHASVLIVSSLSDPDEVSEFAGRYGNDISIIFIPLSDALSENGFSNWLKWLFVENEHDADASQRTRWSLSPLRYQLKAREQELLSIIQSASKSVVL